MNTTISISTEVRDKIKEFGSKGESYSEIIAKILESAKEKQLQDLLLNTNDGVKVSDALLRAKKRWQ